MKKLNALGKKCPIPVIEMKKALKQNNDVQIMVDNKISTQNLKKLADEYKYDYQVTKEAEKKYKVTFMRTEKSGVPNKKVKNIENSIPSNAYTIVVDDNKLGGGDDILGENLLKSFLYAVTEQDILPTHILFYNAGVHLTASDSDTIEDLEKLEEAGVDILTCGLCLDYYDYDKNNIKIGTVTNMYEIVRMLRIANHIVKP